MRTTPFQITLEDRYQPLDDKSLSLAWPVGGAELQSPASLRLPPWVSFGVSLHDSQALIPLVKSIPSISSRRRQRRRGPGKLHADKGYEYSHLRRWLRSRGITHRVARKGIETLQRLGRHRWTIERSVAGLAGWRRLHRRYGHKADHFLAWHPRTPERSHILQSCIEDLDRVISEITDSAGIRTTNTCASLLYSSHRASATLNEMFS